MADLTTAEMQAALEKMRLSIPISIAFLKQSAVLKRAEYLALIDNGFSEDQAIQLLRPKA